MRTVIALLSAVVTLAACDKIGVPNPFAGDKPGSTTKGEVVPVKKTTAARGFARTDLDSLTAAVRDGDYEKLFSLLSVEFQRKQEVEVERIRTALASPDAAVRAKAETELAELKMSPEAFKAGDAKMMAMKLALAKATIASWPTAIREMKAIKADDARAEVVYVDTTGREGTLRFVKEDGEWKLVP